ncbi:MAG: GGDEF domain-containing protein [Oscillospiraceae bacterium]|nr:GGDEF domain-containing protein [Oscillospiraceae bacterium]
MGNNRFNIGLLVANIVDEFSNSVAIGAMRAAKRLDTDLVIFPGKYVGIQRIYEKFETKYEYQYNVLFDHAANAKLDYIIAAVGSIAYAYDDKRKKEFLDGLGDTPILSVAAVSEDYDFLQFENSSGFLSAVNYLAAHGRKHICIMAGSLNNYECSQRYAAYRKGLEDNGLEYEDSYMITCDMSAECREEAERLVDRNPGMDAVLCVNDKIASVMYDVLKERNIKIGTDVAVIGFDDLPLCTKLDPPMASVKADAELLGEIAMEKAVNYLNGIKDDRHYVDTEFIPRRSCYSNTEFADSADKIFSGEPEAIVEDLNDYIREISLDPKEAEIIISVLDRLIEHLHDQYIEREADNSTVDATAALIEEAAAVMERSKLCSFLDEAYIWILRSCLKSNIPFIKKLGGSFHPGHNPELSEKLIDEYSLRTHYNNMFIRDSLMTDCSLTDSYATILKRLSTVGAMTGFIYLFDSPVTYIDGDKFFAATWRFTSYNYGAEAFIVPKEKQVMRTPQVFKNDYLCADRQHIFIVADLFTADTQYGIALLEPCDERFFKDFELVTYQLSSAVRALDSLKNQDKLLTELHTKNLALEKQSKIDSMTKTYNRRGFYPAAEELIGDPQYQGKDFVVCYADLDNLKTVNETYGHIEGDYSITLLADCLKYIFGDGAIIARMGGGEFAVICPISEKVTAENVKWRKDQFIDEFNHSRKKPYFFDFSMGILESPCIDALDLSSILSKTDDLLYIEKKRKEKER